MYPVRYIVVPGRLLLGNPGRYLCFTGQILPARVWCSLWRCLTCLLATLPWRITLGLGLGLSL